MMSQLSPSPVVYLITNKVNGKAYVGVSERGLQARKREHINRSKAGSKFPIHRAIAKYGVDSFEFEILESCADASYLPGTERRLIAEFGTLVPRGYNRTLGGDGVSGLVFGDETRRRMSEKAKQRPPFSEETRRKLSAASAGRVIPRDAVERARKKRVGAKRTDEQRARIAAGRAAGKKPRANKGNCRHPVAVILNALSRVRAGEKQTAVARDVGINQGYLSRLMRGKRGANIVEVNRAE